MKVPAILREIETHQLGARVAINRVAKADCIDAEWVKRRSVEVAERCLQEIKPALHPVTRRQLRDDEGHPLFTFNAAGAIAALRLVGDNVGVRAFEENIKINAAEDLVERLRAGRARARLEHLIDVTPAPASRDTNSDEESSDQ
jgi:hypothetical protein